VEYIRKKLAACDQDIEKTAHTIGVEPAYIQALLKGEPG
jgi:hypothetical protein